ncbi:astacin [Dictyocaulus viviparus]|uniref:Metalloendopeptidase n=1 Tax=Dictyocaulus viviparus TaxID=29172 RepID=A0A0D8XTW3_DICVI|nr:astacin [Dictyocaulus viviparus]
MLFNVALLIYLRFILAASSSVSMQDIIDNTKPDEETVLTEDDFRSFHSEDITKLGIKVKDDPTMGNKMEGDIVVENPRKPINNDNSNRYGRSAIRQAYRKWPNREIPYALSSKYGSYARSVIAKAMQEYHNKTCVRFVPRDPIRHVDYIFIHPDDGCYSLVGKVGGRQSVSLDSGCIQVGTIVHELMHAVGFFHEQSRRDRDEYIEIVWRNVQNGADDQFEKRDRDEYIEIVWRNVQNGADDQFENEIYFRYNYNIIDHLNEEYDYSSIMHYGPYAFSGSGRKTILPRKGGAERMGQRIAFSEGDIRKINKLYRCNDSVHRNSLTDNDQTFYELTPITTVSTDRTYLFNIIANRFGRIWIH